MDRDLIAHALQNIINVNKVQEFEQFKTDHLEEVIRREMLDAAKEYPDQKALAEDINRIISKNKKTIAMIESNQDLPLDQYNIFMEDLRSWRRKYIISQKTK